MKRPAAHYIISLLVVAAVLVASLSLAYPALREFADRTLPADVQRVETWIEEWDSEAHCWVRIDLPAPECAPDRPRLAYDARIVPIAQFGPFVVLNKGLAAVIGTTNAESPYQFERMIAAYPAITQINFIDAAGTVDDVANLKLGRDIRAAGISTHVPANGSVRSGAVDLFLAGSLRTMEEGARFAVHSWRDNYGRGPADFPEHDPVNRLYIDYYIDMGMSHEKAREFYKMTNSVSNSNALWFGPEQMRFWLTAPPSAKTRIVRERAKISFSGFGQIIAES
jgi:hypothetical protein